MGCFCIFSPRTHFEPALALYIPSAMATWAALSPHCAEEDGDGDGDDGDIDACNRSSLFSTPQETIIEEDEEENPEDGDQSGRFGFSDSADVSVALQELKSIRSHLYSAAEYCESAYLYSDQKQAIFENLKDYSVKALVNAVDHVGTVAAKMDELLLKRTKEMSVLEFNMSHLTQQLQAYRDNAICEGLNHYQYARRRRRYGMHYTLSAPVGGGGAKQLEKNWTIVRNTCQPRSTEQRKDDRASDTSGPRTVVWYMTAETPLDSTGRSTPTTPYTMNRSNSSNARNDNKFQGFLSRSFSGGRVSSPKSSPSPSTLDTIQEPVQFLGSSKKLTSLLSLDETKHHDSQTHKKGLLSAFLGKAKSVKSKRLSTLTSFK